MATTRGGSERREGGQCAADIHRQGQDAHRDRPIRREGELERKQIEEESRRNREIGRKR